MEQNPKFYYIFLFDHSNEYLHVLYFIFDFMYILLEAENKQYRKSEIETDNVKTFQWIP